MKKILFFILTLSLGLLLTGCGKSDDKTTDLVKDSDWLTPAEMITKYEGDSNLKVSEVRLTFNFKDDDGIAYIGYMTFVLFNDLAPRTVENFVKLSEKGYYDNLTITRVVEGTTIQGGDPEKTTLKDKKEAANKIKGEFEDNEIFNNLSHRRGVISMARADDVDSASSQFFVVTSKFTSCDGSYAGFGWLLEETKDMDGNTLTPEMRKYTVVDGKKALYDYDCLDAISNLAIEGGNKDGAPVNVVEITKAEVLVSNVSISELK